MLVVARPSLSFGLARLALLLLKKAETFLHLGTLHLRTEFLRRGVEVPPNWVGRRVFGLRHARIGLGPMIHEMIHWRFPSDSKSQ